MTGLTFDLEKTILAVDPGKTTGFAYVEAPLNVREYGEVVNISSETISGLIRKADVVVVEDFKIAPTAARGMSWTSPIATQVITLIKDYCKVMDIDVAIQQPGQANQFFDADKMKWLGYLDKNYPHAMDAITHGLYYAAFRAFKESHADQLKAIFTSYLQNENYVS